MKAVYNQLKNVIAVRFADIHNSRFSSVGIQIGKTHRTLRQALIPATFQEAILKFAVPPVLLVLEQPNSTASKSVSTLFIFAFLG
jgi:hypothetical protein